MNSSMRRLGDRLAHQPERHGRLHMLGQRVHRATDVIVQLRPHPQQVIVGGLELLALARHHQLVLFQVGQRPRAVFEERHPQQILIIPQSAAAVLDVRLLHARRVAKLGPPRGLILQARRDVFVLVAGDAPGQHGFLKLRE